MRQVFKPTKKEIKVKNKKIALNAISCIFFLICSIFVFLRGKDCFSKYFSKPQFVDTSYRLSGRMPFPSFTICNKGLYNWWAFKVRDGHFKDTTD